MLLVLVMAGLKDDVTPPGSPDADRVTLLLKPFSLATSIMLLAPMPLPPRMMVLDEDERLKPGDGIVTETVAELVAVPETPVTVTGYVPAAAVVLLVKVSAVVLELTAANAPVTPAGTPDAVRLTLSTRLSGLLTVILTGSL